MNLVRHVCKHCKRPFYRPPQPDGAPPLVFCSLGCEVDDEKEKR